MKDFESILLESLMFREDFYKKVIPFIKSEYFHHKPVQMLWTCIHDFIIKYNACPSKEAISICLEKHKGIAQSEYDHCMEMLDSFTKEQAEEHNLEWLISETETFCKEKALYNGIMESIHIIDGKSKDKNKTAIPDILSNALAVSFDTNIGHDYLEDSEQRYEFYHTIEKRIPFDLEFMNTITAGGTPTKTLNIVMAGTGVGKSLFLCHHAANCLSQGMNVLYITCEMAEERIAERIDANLLDITLDSLRELPKDVYDKRIESLKQRVSGKLIIKEYPTASANTNHFRILIDELWLKKRFKPDIIVVDYLNICASSRMKAGAVNSYTYIKAIAEELRGLAAERNVPIWSATQVNRTGFSNTDIGLEDTSESFGLPATADFMFALISTEKLDEMNQIMVKQLKNRYNDTASNRKFVLGINRAKMKLYDISGTDQPMMADGNIEVEEEEEETKYTSKFGKKDFSGWKV
jgi:replicative DNA helicase